MSHKRGGALYYTRSYYTSKLRNPQLQKNRKAGRGSRQTGGMIDFGDLVEFIQEQHAALGGLRSGNVASYIPQLAKVNPDLFSISVCTLDGQEFSVGDAGVPFCIQSCSKPFTYCLAQMLDEHVHDHVGHEPSGQRFNAFALNEHGKPFNPLINAGAMVIASLISPHLEPAARFEQIHNCLRDCAGEGAVISFDNSVYLSEQQHADRNYALAHFMKEQGAFAHGPEALEQSVRLYFQACSVQITSASGARMAATLANHGTQPITGKAVFSPAIVRNALSCMLSSGMYDYSGRFAFEFGFPAKSGVSGCTMLPLPGLGGICVWSPPLDELGNSVRGIEFCRALVDRFRHIHMFERPMKSSTGGTPLPDGSTRTYKFIAAANEGDVGALKSMILDKVDVDGVDYDSRSALHLACAAGRVDCVRILLEVGARQSKDRWGSTPRHEAENNLRETHDAKYAAILSLLADASCNTAN